MMNRMVLAAVAATLAASADAAVVDFDIGIIEGFGSVGAGSGSTGNIDFFWNLNVNPDPYAAYVVFETDTASDVFLTEYEPTETGVSAFEVSGVLLEQTDGLNGAVLPGGFLTTDIAGCGSALFSISFPSCNYVSYTSYAGIGSDTATQPGELFFGSIPAGFYRITFLESGTPKEGVAEFEVRESLTAIPLPASMPLLLAGFGGLALVRRGRKGAAP